MRCCLRCGRTPTSRNWRSRPATPAPRSSPTSTTSTSPPARRSPNWPSASAPTWWSSGPRCRWCSASPTPCAHAGIACFGPTKDAARIEGIKSFAKDVMAAAGRAHRGQRDRRQPRPPRRRARPVRPPGRPAAWVVKDDGLAAGKGVVVTADRDAARAHAAGLLDAGHPVLLESFLDGPEVSLFCLVDGETVVPLLAAQDFKRVGDGDTGPNTGGMGAYAPLPWLPDEVVAPDRRRYRETRCRRTGSTRQPVLGPALRRAGDHVAGARPSSNSTAASAIPRRSRCWLCWTRPLGQLLHAAATGRLADAAAAALARRRRRHRRPRRGELPWPPAGRRRHHRRRSRRCAARGHRPSRRRRRSCRPAAGCCRWSAPVPT